MLAALHFDLSSLYCPPLAPPYLISAFFLVSLKSSKLIF